MRPLNGKQWHAINAWMRHHRDRIEAAKSVGEVIGWMRDPRAGVDGVRRVERDHVCEVARILNIKLPK